MKLRRQFTLSIVIFSVALIAISISEVILNQQIVNLDEQEESVLNIQTGVMNLGYLSDNFFFYQEETKLTEYNTTVSSIINEISKLNPTIPQQQTLINNLKADLECATGCFDDVVMFLRSAPRNVSVRVIPEFQNAWNDMSLDRQKIALDASSLHELIEDQASQLSLLNTVLLFAVFGLFGAYLLVNYLLTYRRTLKSILGLKNVTVIVGSGNLEYQIKTDNKDEIGELAVAFNQMATNLKTVTASKSELAKEIDERKKVEGELRDSEQRWATTLGSVGDGVIATDVDGKITFLNKEAEKLTGWTLNEASNKPLKTVFKIINEYTREEVDNPISKAFETGKVVGLANHTILVNKNGIEVAIDDSAAPIRFEDGKIMGVVLVFRDISERRRAERELSDLKDFNEGVVESISEALLVIDPKDYRIIAANSEASRGLNLKKEDLIGKTCYESTHNSSTPCEAPHNCPLREVLVTGKVATANHVHFDKNQNRFDTEISVYPFLENEGEITRVIHISRDITERKKAEEKLNMVMDQLVLINEKLGVVGSLTRHDVRNKLSAVTGYAYLLKKKYANQADIVEGLGKMEQAVKESVKIFEFAKMYEQLGVEKLTYIDVEKTINKAVVLFSGFNLKVVNDCQGLMVLADSFLGQLFYNFMDNTRKYGKKTGTIKVHYQKTDHDSLKLIYEDDGVGIPLDSKPNLFKEGYSTGGSTGFGLFLTKKMIDIYGWEIKENGEPGIGAKFTITIPKLGKSGKENYQITQ